MTIVCSRCGGPHERACCPDSPKSLPPESSKEMLESIATLMEQIETLRDAVNAVLNWYGNDRLIAFPGKQLVEALGGTDASTLPSTVRWPQEEIEPGRFVDVDPEVITKASTDGGGK